MAKTKAPEKVAVAVSKSGSSDSWYLKYRPQVISELDQESVRDALSGFINSGKIPHALLFSGPKGTGKTSAARIIAKILNCEKNPEGTLSEPCNECDSCKSIIRGSSFSVMELDGASNRGIEDIRAIREAVKLSVPGRFRVYIIDEAHMLTVEAANALLKTLEEPPSHVVFILATTEGSRLPETVRSRTTTLLFKKAKSSEVLRALARVVKGEALEISKEKLLEIAHLSGGSFRDAIKILDQTISGGDSLTLLPQNSVDKLLLALSKKDAKGAIEEIAGVEESGMGMRDFLVSVLERLRQIMLVKLGVETSFEEGDIPDIDVDGAKRLIELFAGSARFIAFAPVQSLPLELVVVEWCGESGGESGSHSLGLSRNSDAPIKQGTGFRELRGVKVADSVPLNPSSNKRDVRQSSVSPASFKGGGDISEELWRKILDGVKVKNHTIAALLRSAKPLGMNDGKMQIVVFYEFHKDRLEENKNRAVIEEVCGQLLGGNIKIEFILGEKPTKPVTRNQETVNSPKQEENEKMVEKTGKERVDRDQDIESAAEEIFGRKVDN